MRKSIVFVGAFVLVSFIGSQVCSAQLINYNRRNKNGAAANTGYGNTPKPAPVAAPSAPVVSTVPSMPAAMKEEARPAMDTNTVLMDAVAAVNKNGYTNVTSDALKKYDKNKDGMISKSEARAIEADIR